MTDCYRLTVMCR